MAIPNANRGRNEKSGTPKYLIAGSEKITKGTRSAVTIKTVLEDPL